MDDRDAYIALNGMEQVGPVTVARLVEQLGSAGALFEAGEAAIRAAGGSRKAVEALLKQRAMADGAAEREKAEALGMRLVTPVDAEYPPGLRGMADPPLALYVRGTLEARDRHAVALVGTRRPSAYGREVTVRLAGGLVQAGYTVVSGLAQGVDAVAHEQALAAGGRTIGVLGGGMDRLYPACHEELARRMARQGAVVTEFPPGRQPDRTTFPMRNRIVSGLSRGVVVVEAGEKSGALITARMAGEQGRTVFAVPGRIDSAMAQGCHALLRDGAVLVRGVEDILEELGNLWRPAAAPAAAARAALPQLAPDEQEVLDLLQGGERGVDDLIRESGRAPAQVNALLMGLEIRRLVRVMPGRRVERIEA